MFIENRVKEIEHKYVYLIEEILVLNLTDESLKIILRLRGGTTLRVTERWKGKVLVRYSYYWLDIDNKLKIGWDNAPHHKKYKNFPHHKHIGKKQKITESHEHRLEEVMTVLEKKLKANSIIK